MAGVSAAGEADSAPDLICAPVLEPTISLGDDKCYQHPSVIVSWCDDLKKWPQVQMPHIIHYLLTNKACDLREVNSFRSMESYTYLQSGWVGRVLLHEIDDTLVLLKCQVQASQSIKTHHDAWVCCQRSGEVKNSGCTCMAGRGKVCSHIGALLWKLDLAVSQSLTGEGCTDKSATWNRGTKRNLEPAALTDINFKVQMRTIDNDTCKKTIPSLPQLLGNDTDIQVFDRNCPFQEIVNVTGTLLHATVTAPFRQLQPQQTTPDIQHSPHDSVDTLPQGCMLCNNFYVKYIVLSGASMAALEASTRSQANYLWHVSRRLRITASNIRRIPKRVTTPAEKALQSITSPNFYGNAATQHGINHEVVARLQFQKDFGLDAVQRGIYVCKDKPWLSATPDGIIESHCAILEIKCPFTQDCKEVIRSGKYDVIEKGGVHILNKNGPSGYYSQVQFTMLCTEKQLCFLYVWSPKSAVLIEVPFDPCYVTYEMPRLQRFYFCKMLPCLQRMKSEGKLDLSEYEKIAEM